MAAPPAASGAPITDKRQLVEYIASGSKPAQAWRIGTEHEKFVFTPEDLRRAPYEGPRGIGALLEGLAEAYDWKRIEEWGKVIALTKDGGAISLEPGGQFELSGAPLETIHQTCDEVHTHLAECRAVGERLGLGMLGLGFDPRSRREDVSWMPKGRYKIMGDYMPKKGKLGLDMMLRTCTVQVNLDFADEADMVKKFRVSLALQPIATALFANSPFTEGKPNGFRSYRSHIWTDTDADRCGILPFVFEDGFGFERYVDWMLDVPMYFAYRNGAYLDASGQSFRDFIAGRLPALPGEIPLMSDWVDHMTTAFPEVRLKKFLEMRGADAGPWRRLCALPALWVGLLYDQSALDAAWDECKSWTAEEHAILRAGVPRTALATPFRAATVREVALRVLDIAREGLKRRRRLSRGGDDESVHLDALFTIAGSGRTPADDLLESYHKRWGGSVDPVYTEEAY